MPSYPQLHENVQLRLVEAGVFPQHISVVMLDEPYLNTLLPYAIVHTYDGSTYIFNGHHQPWESVKVPEINIDLPFGRF